MRDKKKIQELDCEECGEKTPEDEMSYIFSGKRICFDCYQEASKELGCDFNTYWSGWDTRS